MHSWKKLSQGIWHIKTAFLFARVSYFFFLCYFREVWDLIILFYKEPLPIPVNPLKPFLFGVPSLLAWDLAVRWGVARCFGQLSHDHWGLSGGLASDCQAPLQMVCGGKQSRDPPCWFIRIQSHLAEDWSCHWPFQCWNTEVLFCTFIELHSVQSGQCVPHCMGKFTEHDMWHALILNYDEVTVQRWVRFSWFTPGLKKSEIRIDCLDLVLVTL